MLSSFFLNIFNNPYLENQHHLYMYISKVFFHVDALYMYIRLHMFLSLYWDPNLHLLLHPHLLHPSQEFASGLSDTEEARAKESAAYLARRDLFSSGVEMERVERKSRRTVMRESAERISLTKRVSADQDRVHGVTIILLRPVIHKLITKCDVDRGNITIIIKVCIVTKQYYTDSW